MFNPLWLSIINGVFISLSVAATEVPSTTYCTLDTQTDDWSAWQACEGQMVKITGDIAQISMQHPTGLHDQFDLINQTLQQRFETYIDLATSQIVATSAQPIKCHKQITLTGKVDIIDLGGAMGKNTYKNVWLKVHDYACDGN